MFRLTALGGQFVIGRHIALEMKQARHSGRTCWNQTSDLHHPGRKREGEEGTWSLYPLHGHTLMGPH